MMAYDKKMRLDFFCLILFLENLWSRAEMGSEIDQTGASAEPATCICVFTGNLSDMVSLATGASQSLTPVIFYDILCLVSAVRLLCLIVEQPL